MTANVKKIKVLSDEEIFKMEPEELLDYLVETFQVTIPIMITPENHLAASTELSKAAQYSKHLSTLKDRAEMRKIKAELDGNPKLKKEMLARQKVFEGFMGIMILRGIYGSMVRLILVTLIIIIIV